jgi:hypothetical protein
MPIARTRSSGLRKYAPQPERYAERYGNFTLTARDYEILDLIYRYRYLEARHVRALVRGSGQQITRRLQGLFHNQFIRRYVPRLRMRPDLDPGTPPLAYGLELRGARALQAQCARIATDTGAEPELVRWRKEYTRRTEWFLEHHLMISHFHCALELALRGTPDIELVTWTQGKEIWFSVRIPGAKKRTARVAPDAYFALRQGAQIRYFFLEADRGTEQHKRIVEKFMGYWSYFQPHHLLGPHCGQGRVNALFLTTGAKRMRNLIDTLARTAKPSQSAQGRGVFLFADSQSVTMADAGRVLDSIWTSVSRAKIGIRPGV